MPANSKALFSENPFRRFAASLRNGAQEPVDVGALVTKGDEANRRRDWQEAEKAYAAALGADPSLKHIWVQYGHSLKEQGLLERAEAAYRRSLQLDDSIADTHQQLSDVLMRQGRVEEAKTAWDVAVRLAPELMVNPRDTAMREAFDFILTMTQPKIVCDIGSLDGGEAVRFGQLLPDARVFAFEASGYNFAHFVEPRIAEAGAGNIKAEHLAIGDTIGATEFHVVAGGDEIPFWRRCTGSLYRRKDSSADYVAETVATTTLDKYFENDLDQTFLLWIDVEGALDRVIRGASRVLARTIALRAEIEHFEFWYGQTLAAENVRHIEELGFRMLFETGPADTQSDALFLNRNWRDLVRIAHGNDSRLTGPKIPVG